MNTSGVGIGMFGMRQHDSQTVNGAVGRDGNSIKVGVDFCGPKKIKYVSFLGVS